MKTWYAITGVIVAVGLILYSKRCHAFDGAAVTVQDEVESVS